MFRWINLLVTTNINLLVYLDQVDENVFFSAGGGEVYEKDGIQE